jgi:hypothetical protein
MNPLYRKLSPERTVAIEEFITWARDEVDGTIDIHNRFAKVGMPKPTFRVTVENVMIPWEHLQFMEIFCDCPTVE